MLRVQFATCEYRSHSKNDYDCAAICWIYKTLTDEPGSRNRTLAPLVLLTRISKPTMTLLSTGTAAIFTNESVFFPPLIPFSRITPRQTSSRAQLRGSDWCKSQRRRRNGRQSRYCLNSNHFQLMRQIKEYVMSNCVFF
jgi:hypothetical protein